jgi:molybdopterin-guanine dinucleotide biosynthesis protein A
MTVDDASTAWTAVILSGGRSSRLGQDKARATVGGRTLLALALDSIPAGVPCIVVGPRVLDPGRQVVWAVEAEPFGGPVSGLASGLEHVSTSWIALLAVDMPSGGDVVSRLVESLSDAAPDVDGLVPVDETGRLQPLAGVYRTAALRTALSDAETLFGASLHGLVDRLRIERVDLAAAAGSLRDIDTPDDLEAERRSVQANGSARHRPTTGGATAMEAWVEAAAKALDLDAEVDVDRILDVAREAAHAVARPMAPVTTFLMGRAVAAGMTAEEAARRLTDLAQGWTPDTD